MLDLIYNPAKPALLLDAERRGIRCANGLHMLVAQAKLASELFRGGTKLDDSIIDAVRADIERQTHNIVLIGMPGSGKTTIGKCVAGRLGRRLLDTDAMIPGISGGISAGDIIRTRGEKEFRAIETQAICEAGKQSGCVIATGGGVVTQPANTDPLRQNSVIFFIDRPLNSLELGNDRPLSATREQNARLYEQRLPLYEALCYYRIENVDLSKAISDVVSAFNAHFGEAVK